MSGPISVTKITGGDRPDPAYSQHSITITLNFDAMHMPSVDLNVVEKMLTADQWSDGRYPFYAEMLHVGLSRLLESAVGAAVGLKMQKEYGRETVQTDPNTQMSRAHLETEKAMKGFSAHILDSIKRAEINRPIK